MAFDGITTTHLIKELRDDIVDGRIRKIYQPEADEIRLTINKGRDNYNLLLSANANNPRVYLTEKPKGNPNTPPGFCMVLRKYILNGMILDIRQHQSDRVMEFHIACKNEFGDTVVRCLLVEIMGRNSNIILTDGPADGLETPPAIMDSLKKVGSSSNRYRQILPGRPYIFPPESGRRNFFTLTEEAYTQMATDEGAVPLSKLLVQGFLGVSPILAREICFRAGVPDSASFSDLSSKQIKFLWQSFSDIRGEIQTGPIPTLYTFHRDIVDFSTVDLHHLVDTDGARYPKVSAMLEDFYYLKDKKIRFTARSANLKHQLGTLYKKSAKKLQNLKQDMQRSHSDEKSKLFGDLVTANIYQIERGMKSITVPDYNDPEMGEVTIPLKVNETPSQNAQRFYKKYNKAKRAQIQLADQIAITEEQTYYLDSLLNALEQCTELAELDEIRHEFDQSEFAKKNPHPKKAAKRPEASKPMHYISSEGFHIYVGKNNYQNDYISTRLGVDEDCWLHVKDIPGSHVLVVADGRFITEATLLEAGMLAAWYSKARNSENVPVDYLEFKFLKKPNKSKPGMVIFTDQNTMYVTPKREAILGLTVVE